MSSYQHRDPHIKDKKVFRQGNPHTWARRSLYWDGVLVLVIKHYNQASNISRTTDRRSSNYIWVINTFITYSGVTYISDLTAVVLGEQMAPHWGGGGKMAAVPLPAAILDDPISVSRGVTSWGPGSDPTGNGNGVIQDGGRKRNCRHLATSTSMGRHLFSPCLGWRQ